MSGYPQPITGANHVEPAPRRIRGEVAGSWVFDTTQALYLWEWPFYPQYLIPVQDITAGMVSDGQTHQLSRGTVVSLDLRVGEVTRANAGRRYVQSTVAGIDGCVRFDWDAIDAWFEEDEQIFVHPRSPYVRVDALRSSRRVRVQRDGGVLLAESNATVMVFETGLPTRYYFDRTAVDFGHLTASQTVTACPYKGQTTAYWGAEIGDVQIPDLAWSYDFPTRQLLPITGLVAFYDEIVDTFIDGVEQPRPVTHHRSDA
jgi:uncharacterized protein (DUF427 family)